MEIASAETPFHAVIVTIFPELIEAVASVGVFGRAVERGLVRLETINPRAYTEDRHQTVDSKAYGGGPGMVMKVGPLRAALQEARRRCPEANNFRQSRNAYNSKSYLRTVPAVACQTRTRALALQ